VAIFAWQDCRLSHASTTEFAVARGELEDTAPEVGNCQYGCLSHMNVQNCVSLVIAPIALNTVILVELIRTV